MSTAPLTLEENRCRGSDTLARELGAVGIIRFLQRFEIDTGDYTHERQ